MRLIKLASFFAFAFFMLFGSMAAHAATYNFSFDYVDNALPDFSFQLPSSPGGPGFVPGTFFILVSDVTDSNHVFYPSIVFFDSGAFGGMEAILNDGSPDPFNFSGPQLFTAALENVPGLKNPRYAHPTFVLGSFQLYDAFADEGAPPIGTLTITAVPETSTWAMMILGFASIGFMVNRRKANLGLLAAR